MATSVVTKPPTFKQFDIVLDHPDHYFSGKKKKNSSISSNSMVYKRIMREWKILQKHLPDTIYVRAYETRIDLLRAVIIGAQGTPYHDGLFFFDINFPDDYPNKPPEVYYRSHGLRLNPNLYANGYVCLSLLNTWSGNRNERWGPFNSTILQVLVSIQALVLNETPYFNEPGTHFWGKIFRRTVKHWSEVYTEEAFITTWTSTLYLLQNPPKNFGAFVARHFRQRAKGILEACEAYAEARVAVGHYSKDVIKLARTDFNSPSCGDTSKKFKKTMKKLYPQLVDALSAERFQDNDV